MLVLHAWNCKLRSLVVGVLCDVFNVMMYVAPLTIMISNNGLGAISGLIQLTLYACYYYRKPAQVDDDASKHNNEVQLSTINASANV
ncbi:hypothetical protein K1719_040824 [Acacia pycnantha]|nr:hypothetical protein K1719_040824 [Acacia pycnantha]